MAKNIKYIFLFLLSVATLNVFAQGNSKKGMDLYILMGQSNMAGRGPITDEFKNEGNDSVYVFNKANEWVLARHPLHFDKPDVAAVGPGLSFGIKMAEASPKARIGLIPCAVGGTSITRWLPGAFDAATNTHPYDDAVKRITAAMPYGTIKGVIWHQGESDASADKATLYLDQLAELILRVRLLVGNPTLPFIVGELGQFRKANAFINNQLNLLPQKVKFTAVASSANLIDKGDGLHFDGASANELGRRYAEKMLQVQQNLRK